MKSTAGESDTSLVLRSADGAWRLGVERGQVLFSVTGEVLQQVDRAFVERALHQLTKYRDRGVVIDCSACRNLSSSGIGFVVQFHRACQSHGLRVVVVRPLTGRVDELFQTLGLDHLSDIADDRSGAYAMLAIDGD